MSAPSYDLAVQGITGFSRYGRVLSQRKISRDSLSGIVDVTNKTFHTNYYPILTSGSLLVYDGLTQVPGVADYDTGEITLTSVPTNQPVATYTFTPYTALQVLQFLIHGFDELESRWQRSYKLVDSSGNNADENSANIFVSDKDENEPVISGVNFSDSRLQIYLLMLCTEYRYYLSQLGEASVVNYMWRETVRGMTVDKSKIPENIKIALDALDKRITATILVAEEQFYGGSNFGGFDTNPATLDYMHNMEWQTNSRDQDYKSQGLHFSYRPFY